MLNACREHGYGCDCKIYSSEDIAQADADNVYESFLFCYEDELDRYCKPLRQKIKDLEEEIWKLKKKYRVDCEYCEGWGCEQCCRTAAEIRSRQGTFG